MDIYPQVIKYLGDMKYMIDFCESDEEMYSKGLYIRFFSNEYLNNAFENNNYGSDVEEICILIQLIRVDKNNEHLFRIHKPKYYEHIVLNNALNDCQWEWTKRFQIEIRFTNEVYDAFLFADENESNKILACETLKALKQLDYLPKRLIKFDKEAFQADVRKLYDSYGWL